MAKYNLTLDKEQENEIRLLQDQQIDWDVYVHEDNKHLVTDSAIDLISKLLAFDFNERITAAEALKHPYFEEKFEEIFSPLPTKEKKKISSKNKVKEDL